MTIDTLLTNDALPSADDRPPVAELRHIRAGYRRDDTVLSDLSLMLRAAEIFVLMGPNGAGKTTLVRVLTGRLKPTGGVVTGASANSRKGSAVRLVPQDIALFPLMSARENCVAFARMAGAGWRDAAVLADRALVLASCRDIAAKRVGGLSGGFRRRVNIAVALVGSPRLLILDEPTTGIDAEAKSVIAATIRALKETGISILIVTHDFDDADALADRAGFLFNGRLVLAGLPRDLIGQAFGNKKQIEIVLSSPPGQAEQQRLKRLGAAATPSEVVWETFQNLEGRHAEYIATLSEGSLPVKEIRIRDPGLGTLYRHLGGSDPA